jgi:uncharacterized protein
VHGDLLRELADKIVGEQRPVHDGGFYFCDPTASATYARWAGVNPELWSCTGESLDDPNLTQLLANVR